MKMDQSVSGKLTHLVPEQLSLLRDVTQACERLPRVYRKLRWGDFNIRNAELQGHLEEAEFQLRQDAALIASQLARLGLSVPLSEVDLPESWLPSADSLLKCLTFLRDHEETLIGQLLDGVHLAQVHGLYGLELQLKVVLMAAEHRHQVLRRYIESKRPRPAMLASKVEENSALAG